jgi:toxin CcdB
VAQFDVHMNPSPREREGFPYVVELQSTHLRYLPTRLVMPLQRLPKPPAGLPRRLTQTVRIEGEHLYLAAHQCAAVPERLLKKPVLSLAEDRHTILDALDAVVSGV